MVCAAVPAPQRKFLLAPSSKLGAAFPFATGRYFLPSEASRLENFAALTANVHGDGDRVPSSWFGASHD